MGSISDLINRRLEDEGSEGTKSHRHAALGTKRMSGEKSNNLSPCTFYPISLADFFSQDTIRKSLRILDPLGKKRLPLFCSFPAF